MLSSKWNGRGHTNKKKKKEDKPSFVQQAGDGIKNKQNAIQKAMGRDTTAVAIGGISVAIGNTNINVPINLPIANQGTGGSINEESGPGDLLEKDEIDFDIF
ncbi:hypothetical protein J7E71_10300 [Mesobacillus foraminis]|uniref:hypothetical protein n=1 Tax=Mesobacillus foraminis TaxID=279826 RepID=UPI001BE9C991|nr:hypothetical protein [Mesobacillus foraminis]MBT2756343.1 hypothetical protein [Mesobacillus foraminis]